MSTTKCLHYKMSTPQNFYVTLQNVCLRNRMSTLQTICTWHTIPNLIVLQAYYLFPIKLCETARKYQFNLKFFPTNSFTYTYSPKHFWTSIYCTIHSSTSTYSTITSWTSTTTIHSWTSTNSTIHSWTSTYYTSLSWTSTYSTFNHPLLPIFYVSRFYLYPFTLPPQPMFHSFTSTISRFTLPFIPTVYHVSLFCLTTCHFSPFHLYLLLVHSSTSTSSTFHSSISTYSIFHSSFSTSTFSNFHSST